MKPTVKELEKQFAPYENRYGFFTAGGDIDHIPLFHGFYLLILDKYELLDEAEIRKQRKLMSKLIHPEYPGLIMPRPKVGQRGNDYSHDTHKAMIWISKRLGMSFAKDFLVHGRSHGYWNPINPREFNVRGIYWRFPGMIAQAQIASGEAALLAPWLYAELFAASFTGKHKRVEKVTLPVFMCKTIEDYGPIAHLTVKRWRSVKSKAYPGGLGEVLQQWGGPWRDSPYVEHLWGTI